MIPLLNIQPCRYDILYVPLAPAEVQLAMGQGYIRNKRIPKAARVLGERGENYRNRLTSM